MMAISSSWQQQLSLDLDSVHRIGIYPHTSYLSFLVVRRIAIKDIQDVKVGHDATEVLMKH